MSSNAFTPAGIAGGTVALAVTNVTASIALAFPTEPEIELYNDGPDVVFVVPGLSGVVATVPTAAEGGYHVAPGTTKIIRNHGYTHIAAITSGATKTGTLYPTCGRGE